MEEVDYKKFYGYFQREYASSVFMHEGLGCLIYPHMMTIVLQLEGARRYINGSVRKSKVNPKLVALLDPLAFSLGFTMLSSRTTNPANQKENKNLRSDLFQAQVQDGDPYVEHRQICVCLLMKKSSNLLKVMKENTNMRECHRQLETWIC